MATVAIGPARLGRRPDDHGPRAAARVPRAGPAVRRLRDLRPRGPRVRADALGRRAATATTSVALVLEYSGPDAPAAVRDGPTPTASRRSCATSSGRAPRTSPRRPDVAAGRRARSTASTPGPPMVRMWVDRAPLPAVPGDRPAAAAGRDRRAQPALPARVRVVAAVDARSPRASTTASASTASWSPRPGTHVISPTARLAVVGNVLTHVDYRGRGFATAVTGAVTAELLRTCDQVVLNVRVRQPARAQRLPAARLRRARPLRGAARPSPRLAVARPRGAAAPPLRPQGDRPSMTTASARCPPTTSPTSASPPRASAGSSGPSARCPSCASSASASSASGRSTGLRIGACLHVTTETANLMRTLKAGGAEVVLAASNPLSTKDDVAAALVAEYGIATFARRGEDRDTYYAHLNAVADTHPQLTMDDGCDLVSLLHSERPDQVPEVLAGHRGDDDRRHPAQGDGRRRRARLPGHRGQRGPDQAPLRQPLRHRPVDARRHPARDEHPHRRPQRRRRRLRLGRARASRRGWPGTARTSRSSRSTRSARSRRSWTASRS